MRHVVAVKVNADTSTLNTHVWFVMQVKDRIEDLRFYRFNLNYFVMQVKCNILNEKVSQLKT